MRRCTFFEATLDFCVELRQKTCLHENRLLLDFQKQHPAEMCIKIVENKLKITLLDLIPFSYDSEDQGTDAKSSALK